MEFWANNTTSTVPVGLEYYHKIRAYCLGTLLILICIPGLIGNTLVCYVMAAKGFLNSSHSSMYNLQFSLLIAETIHLTSVGIYLGPSSVAQSWFSPDDWTRVLPGVWLLIGWYAMLITFCLLGVNR